MQNTKIGFSANLGEIRAAIEKQPCGNTCSSWAGQQVKALESFVTGLKKGEKLNLARGSEGPDAFVKWRDQPYKDGHPKTLGETLKHHIANRLGLADAGVIES